MQTNQINNPKITIEEFVENAPAELELKVLAGFNGLSVREISSARIQKLGLALAGFSHYIHPGRVQIVGQSEISYLNQLDREKRFEAINHLELEKISCILLTKNLRPPDEVQQIADEQGLPIITSALVSSAAITNISKFLQEKLAPQTTIHSVLMEIYGLGILMIGNSGIGKSECALDLISRGHRLISDDSVIIKRIGDKLEGVSPELTSEHLEIRGLGIINIRDLFGVSAVGKHKQIDVCIELKKWNEVGNVERIGIDTEEEIIFGVKIPKFVLPVSSGRNLAILIETAVRIYLLKKSGFDAAKMLVEKHSKLLSGQ